MQHFLLFFGYLKFFEKVLPLSCSSFSALSNDANKSLKRAVIDCRFCPKILLTVFIADGKFNHTFSMIPKVLWK